MVTVLIVIIFLCPRTLCDMPGDKRPQQKIFWTWHGPCRVDLADRLGMVFDRRVGTDIAVKDLLNAVLRWGQLSPGL